MVSVCVCVCIYTHTHTQNWGSFGEVDEPRTCYTEWSTLETEKQVLYSEAFLY